MRSSASASSADSQIVVSQPAVVVRSEPENVDVAEGRPTTTMSADAIDWNNHLVVPLKELGGPACLDDPGLMRKVFKYNAGFRCPVCDVCFRVEHLTRRHKKLRKHKRGMKRASAADIQWAEEIMDKVQKAVEAGLDLDDDDEGTSHETSAEIMRAIDETITHEGVVCDPWLSTNSEPMP